MIKDSELVLNFPTIVGTSLSVPYTAYVVPSTNLGLQNIWTPIILYIPEYICWYLFIFIFSVENSISMNQTRYFSKGQQTMFYSKLLECLKHDILILR